MYQLTIIGGGVFFLPVNFRQKCIIVCDPCGSMIDCFGYLSHTDWHHAE